MVSPQPPAKGNMATLLISAWCNGGVKWKSKKWENLWVDIKFNTESTHHFPLIDTFLDISEFKILKMIFLDDNWPGEQLHRGNFD